MFGDIISAYGGTDVRWNTSTVDSMIVKANNIGEMMGGFDESQYITTLCTDMRMRLRDYSVKDSRISGDGRTDIILFPKNNRLPTVVFELRIARTEEDYEHSFMSVNRIDVKGPLRELNGKTVRFGITLWENRHKVSIGLS